MGIVSRLNFFLEQGCHPYLVDEFTGSEREDTLSDITQHPSGRTKLQFCLESKGFVEYM